MVRLTLHVKVLAAFLALALIPLAFLAYDSILNLRRAEQYLTSNTTAALDDQATRALRLRAETVASAISDFLHRVEEDLWDLSRLPRTAGAWQPFLAGHHREVWYRAGDNRDWREVREQRPLYREAAYIDLSGEEQLRIRDGRVVPLRRNVADHRNTTYRSEDYFLKARGLPQGELYISPVTGWYVSRDEQLLAAKSPLEAVEGKRFEGVIRFAAPLFDARGVRQGVLVLSLDHVHLAEFTQHLTPDERNFTVFASYASGNYAFQFDHEGWMIAHPKQWDIRGLDPEGRLVPAYGSETPREIVEAGFIPFNLFEAGFIHPNYPVVARAVLDGGSGVVDVTNVGGSKKVMAYAPILYDRGPYAGSGVFGGVTIGAELGQFHQPAVSTSRTIREEITRFVSRSTLLITLTVLMVFVAGYLLSRGITRPLMKLTLGTREMARGNLSTRVTVSTHDEIGELTDSFNAMADELNARRLRLLRTLQALRRSRREILSERNFKETVVEHVETGLVTYDGPGVATYANGPAQRLLGVPPLDEPRPLAQLLEDWPEFREALARTGRQEHGGRWSDYISVEREGVTQTYRLAVLPLDAAGNQYILSIEDLTERVLMRQQMARMDRLASLGRMAAGIAHEVRNPLTGVNLLLDELHDRLLSNPDDQVLIRQALGEIERLEGLVNGLLDFSLQSSSEFRPLDIGMVLSETLALFRRQCDREGVALDVDIPEGTPEVTGDAGKLKQAFINLLANALEATPRGGGLRVKVIPAPHQIQIVFSDTGEGISPERLPLIFEPFFTSKSAGSGLGLAITHNIVSEHGGRIDVDSRPGAGSRFTVTLPLSG